MNGYIIVDKEKGMTSHDVVSKLRKILNTKKIGHTGTLDPDTTGVLAVAVGNACKTISYLPEKQKEYVCTIKIGVSTDTEDISGKVLKTKACQDLKVEAVKNVLKDLLKIKEQIPPMYSAVKIKGKKLYEYARLGETVTRLPRPIEVYDVVLMSKITYANDCAYFTFKIRASKGIYIRSICVTIGELLGFPACMQDLRRTRSGNFDIKNASTLEKISMGNYELIPTLEALDLPKVKPMPWDEKKVLNGGLVQNRYGVDYPFCFIMDNKLVAIYTYCDEQYLKCLRGFYER